MKEKPIIFSAPMVRAILEGRKSMTRRIVKCREEIACLGTAADWNAGKLDERMPDWETWGPKSGAQVFVGKHGNIFSLNCPYGVPGDRLWVRETFQDYCPIWSGGWCGHGTREGIEKEHGVWYGAGAPHRGPLPADPPLKWKPSIHMPRWASRITLEIVSVRVERLQEISEEDAEKEGVPVNQRAPDLLHPSNLCVTCGQHRHTHVGKNMVCFGGKGTVFSNWTYKGGFSYLWESIHGPGSWEQNPWVWVIEFRGIA